MAKLYAYWIIINYRESYDLFACNGILFNHESPRRGETFVTRKITRAAARIKEGIQEKLFLGTLNSMRDWGYAPEYVEGMWLMLQQDTPNDILLATGKQHSVRDFTYLAFNELELKLNGLVRMRKNAESIKKNGKIVVEVDHKYFRPAEVDTLLGDPSKAKELLGGNQKCHFRN